ncbi:MAG: L-seryl-tRNA(Sec) selenium transferase [Defluviitaleaceae bacterium]|nr:L-seryl-tRNA(Sec) selenium transferase [Defluviitaleaceae bacterium]
MNGLLRAIPGVDEMLANPVLRGVGGHFLLVEAVRGVLADLRGAILSGAVTAVPALDELAAQVLARLARDGQSGLRRVINGTGVVLHTNLGRAPLAQEALDAINEAARGYSNLEYDLEAGVRGSRFVFVEDLLVRLTGAEAAMVVNNNAAAVMLALAAVAGGRGVITSRGELVEIGGSFRIPDVCEQSGCRLVEVGTTNKTHLRDYEAALETRNVVAELPEVEDDFAGAIHSSASACECVSGAILRVHASNFKMTGFVSRPALADLAALARAHGVPLIEDLGSGQLAPIWCQLKNEVQQSQNNHDDTTVANSICNGADIVTFSGDKLLGGPQAGILVGRADLIAKMKKHPLARALRIDKLSLAALEATLRLYLDADKARQRIPTLQMMTASQPELHDKAAHLVDLLLRGTDAEGAGEVPKGAIRGIECAALSSAQATLEPSPAPVTIRSVSSQTGGGAMPGEDLPSYAVAISHAEKSAAEIERFFRSGSPPIIGRIARDEYLLDVRTLDAADFAIIATRYAQLCGVNPSQLTCAAIDGGYLL